MFGVPRIYEGSPHVKAIMGLIHQAAFLLKHTPPTTNKTTANTSATGSAGF